MKLRIISLLFLAVPAFISSAEGPVSEGPKAGSVAVKSSSPKLDGETRLVLRSISERYKKLKSWRATFTQETFSVGLGNGTFNEGRFDFVPPNKFRYAIMQPDASDFISNGTEAWQVVYRKGRGNAAFVRHFKNARRMDLERYLILLRGIAADTDAEEAKLLKDFELKGKAAGSEISLEMKPRLSTEISKVTLVFRNGVEAPYRAILVDALGNRTTITIATFESAKGDVDEKIFKPEIPKGSETEEL